MTISERSREITLPTGGRAVILPTAVKDVVTIQGSLIGGPSAFPASDGMASVLAADLLDAGAGKLSKQAFRESLAARGIEISFDAHDARLSFAATCFPEDLKYALERIADAIFAPHLPASELAPEKTRVGAMIDEESTDTNARSTRALARMLYSSAHPNRPLSLEEERRQVVTASLASFKGIARGYGTKHLALAIVGDVDVKAVQPVVEKVFGKREAGWARPKAAPMIPATRPDPKRENIVIADKANADVAAGGTLGFGAIDDRYLPTMIVAHMLGGGGFSSHLMKTVRERDGLTYGVNAHLKGLSDKLDGYLQIWGTFAPHLLIRGTDTLLRETSIFLKSGVTAESLASSKEEVNGFYAVSLSTTQGLAARLVRFMEDDRPISRIDEYPDLINAITLDEAQAAAAHLASLPLSIATAGSI